MKMAGIQQGMQCHFVVIGARCHLSPKAAIKEPTNQLLKVGSSLVNRALTCVFEDYLIKITKDKNSIRRRSILYNRIEWVCIWAKNWTKNKYTETQSQKYYHLYLLLRIWLFFFYRKIMYICLYIRYLYTGDDEENLFNK